MYEVFLTPAVVNALRAAGEDLQRRFFLVADHLATYPLSPESDAVFWEVGEHSDLYRPPLLMEVIFMEDIRVLYQRDHLRRDDGSELHRIRVYAFSDGPSPIAGWESP
jgi:hypothetical protein